MRCEAGTQAMLDPHLVNNLDLPPISKVNAIGALKPQAAGAVVGGTFMCISDVVARRDCGIMDCGCVPRCV